MPWPVLWLGLGREQERQGQEKQLGTVYERRVICSYINRVGEDMTPVLYPLCSVNLSKPQPPVTIRCMKYFVPSDEADERQGNAQPLTTTAAQTASQSMASTMNSH
jgi:hypothetical protein